jgi:hypothetical protein
VQIGVGTPRRSTDWREWDSRYYPWRSYFAEIKERRRRIIRTPEQFWKVFAACTRFVVEESRRNPDFGIPEQFLRIVVRVKPILDELWPQIEERYRAIQAEKQATSLLQAPSTQSA